MKWKSPDLLAMAGEQNYIKMHALEAAASGASKKIIEIAGLG